MRRLAIAVSALLLTPFPAASAQVTTSAGDASTRIYNWCMKRPDGTPSECGCVAGFYAGATENDTFRIVARMVENLTSDGAIIDEPTMFAAIREEADGQSISDERLNEIITLFTTFDQLGQKSDSICVPLRGRLEATAE